jgi:hypothetical protein
MVWATARRRPARGDDRWRYQNLVLNLIKFNSNQVLYKRRIVDYCILRHLKQTRLKSDNY